MQRFPTPIDHCYILCDPLKEPDRAAYLETWFETNQISKTQYTFCMPTYGTDPWFQTEQPWLYYNPWVRQRTGQRLANWSSHNLKAGELSLLFNFALVAKRAIQEGHSVVMILESDVLFCENFLHKLKDAMHVLPPQWDFLSLSASADLKPQRAEEDVGRLWFPPINPYFHTRCTDSMIFRVSMLEKILNTFFPCAEVLDWELNHQLTLHQSKSFWLDPPIIRQGSGKEYPTTL